MGRTDVTLNIFYGNKKQNEKQGKRWDENSSDCSHLLNYYLLHVVCIPGGKALHAKSAKTRQSTTNSS